jgi:hypothetical protein
MFLVMPGALPDDIGDEDAIDYEMIKVSIIDLRVLDEVIRWPLQDCGNGNYNATAFEECDYNRVPPRNDDQYTGLASTALTVVVDGATVSTTAGSIWYDPTTTNYYQCNTICFQTTVDLCGDGW